MRTFDRIILVMLALGVWALVLTPQELGAHHQYDDGHQCSADGTGWGQLDGTDVWIYTLDIAVDCTHY